ncbi:MAG: hypothetical protein GWN58_53950 [Anaerolineae bacterium]|nr:hypothetical protein [Anaerolineae bacterium]
MTQQLSMFTDGEDLPLFSETAPKGSIEPFAPKTEHRQESLATCRACLDTGVLGEYAFCWCEAGQKAKERRDATGPIPIEYVNDPEKVEEIVEQVAKDRETIPDGLYRTTRGFHFYPETTGPDAACCGEPKILPLGTEVAISKYGENKNRVLVYALGGGFAWLWRDWIEPVERS